MEEQPGTQGPDPGPPPVTRPNLLTVLCILSLVNGGLTLVSSIIVGTFFEQFAVIAGEFAEKFKLPGMEMITEGRPMFFFVNAVLYAFSMSGAILMLRMKKNGFHVYTVSQIVLILTPMYFYHLPGPSIFDIILTGTFVMLYYIHLKLMT